MKRQTSPVLGNISGNSLFTDSRCWGDLAFITEAPDHYRCKIASMPFLVIDNMPFIPLLNAEVTIEHDAYPN